MAFPWIGVLVGTLLWLLFAGAVKVAVEALPRQVEAETPVAQVEQHPVSVQQSLSEQRDSIVAEEARKIGVPVHLAVAVSHIENWSGDSMAVSSKGAVGLMQVMPKVWQHEFEEDCGCGPLFPRRRNACLGVHVMQYYRAKHPSWELAMRAYHGSYDHPQGRKYIADLLEELTAMRRHVEPKDSPDRSVTSTHPKEGA